jgi:hypothetical protein
MACVFTSKSSQPSEARQLGEVSNGKGHNPIDPPIEKLYPKAQSYSNAPKNIRSQSRAAKSSSGKNAFIPKSKPPTNSGNNGKVLKKRLNDIRIKRDRLYAISIQNGTRPERSKPARFNPCAGWVKGSGAVFRPDMDGTVMYESDDNQDESSESDDSDWTPD